MADVTVNVVEQAVQVVPFGTEALTPIVESASAAAVLAGHYANDSTDTDVPGGSVGDRGAKYWANKAQTDGAAQVALAADQVDLAAAQVVLATAQSNSAASSAIDAADYAADAGNAAISNLFSIFSQVTSNPPETASVIQANGWEIINSAPSDLSLGQVKVVRQGYDTSALPKVWVDTLYRTKRVRQVYPNQASFTSTEETLSDYVYSTDFVFGLANQSTETSPKPIANWVMPDRLTVASSVHWEITAFHKDARNWGAGGVGQQVACVRVRATDGTNYTAWQSDSSTSLSTYIEWANAPEVFSGDIDVSGLTDGLIWLEAEVYPWLGAAASVLKSEDNQTAGKGLRAFTRRYFLKNATKANTPWRAYVASTGNDTTGVASQTDATAAASPCLTVGGALAKLRTAAGATTRGSIDNAQIFIVDSVNMGTPAFQAYYPQDIGAVVITRASGTARASAVVTINQTFRPYFSDHTSGITTGALLFKDVSVVLGGAFNMAGEASSRLVWRMWNCNFNLGGFATSMRSNSDYHLYGVVATNYNANFQQTSAGQVRSMCGVTVDLATGAPEGWLTVGCQLTRASGPAYADASEDGHIFYNNKYLNPHSTNVPIRFVGSVSGGNLGSIAIAQNLVERIDTGQQPNLSISADSAFGNITHAVVIHNTTTGDANYGRSNIFYDEHPTVARTHKLHCYKGNLSPQDNTKGDIFMTNGARIGNFPFHHGVGCAGNFSKSVNASSGALSFGQLYGGIGTAIAGGDPLFTDNKSVSATGPTAGAGGGTYTLQSGSPAKNIQPIPLLKYDLAGNSRGTGTQHAGAYQA